MALKSKEESRELARKEQARAISPFEHLERQFEEFFRRPFPMLRQPWWPARRVFEAEELSPSVDIFEDAGDIVLKAELPGMSKQDITVDLTDHIITISGEKKKEEKIEDKNFYRVERSYGAFTRSFELPSDVKADQVKAKFHDGVLEVRLPKTEEAKRKAKSVPIE
ncbi:MAG: Hsp20/alpha crystallin family protein [Nitrospiraceae bacterium]|nr:Hsp20/alpha crystallin family protein [Nitrospiraceae bacterium]